MDEKPTRFATLSYLPVRQDDGVIADVRFFYILGSAMVLVAAAVVWVSLEKYSKAELESQNMRRYLEEDARRYLLAATIMTVLGFVLLLCERIRARPDCKAATLGFIVLYAGIAISYFGRHFGHIGPFVALLGIAISVAGGIVLLMGLATPLFGKPLNAAETVARVRKH